MSHLDTVESSKLGPIVEKVVLSYRQGVDRGHVRSSEVPGGLNFTFPFLLVLLGYHRGVGQVLKSNRIPRGVLPRGSQGVA